jgi:hypothetical protein
LKPAEHYLEEGEGGIRESPSAKPGIELFVESGLRPFSAAEGQKDQPAEDK